MYLFREIFTFGFVSEWIFLFEENVIFERYEKWDLELMKSFEIKKRIDGAKGKRFSYKCEEWQTRGITKLSQIQSRLTLLNNPFLRSDFYIHFKCTCALIPVRKSYINRSPRETLLFSSNRKMKIHKFLFANTQTFFHLFNFYIFWLQIVP